jgi:hypothetical protein
MTGDPVSTLAALREQGVAAFDPVRWRYLEVLAERLPTLTDAARATVSARFTTALADYQQRWQTAAVPEVDPQTPNAPRPSALAELVQRLSLHPAGQPVVRVTSVPPPVAAGEGAGEPVATVAEAPVPPQPMPNSELKAVHYFRETWTQLSIDRLLSQSLARAPANAGPLNSHLLVIRALTVMRDTAPAYLSSFLTYAEALLWLDQAGGLPGKAAPRTAKASAGKAASKPAAKRSAMPRRKTAAKDEPPTA